MENSITLITDNEIAEYNKLVKDMSATELIRWAKQEFGKNIYTLSSFGVDSCLMLEVIKQSGVRIPVITIDSGFLFNETHAFKDELMRRYSLEIINCYPSQQSIDYIKEVKLWETHARLYYDIVKLEPLSRVIRNKKITALISGIRSDQTENRADMERISRGNDGELRIHPILDWTQEYADTFFTKNHLPRHPLFYEGYASVGDWTTTTKGDTREESRKIMNEKMECGIHLPSNPTPTKSLKEAK